MKILDNDPKFEGRSDRQTDQFFLNIDVLV